MLTVALPAFGIACFIWMLVLTYKVDKLEKKENMRRIV